LPDPYLVIYPVLENHSRGVFGTYESLLEAAQYAAPDKQNIWAFLQKPFVVALTTGPSIQQVDAWIIGRTAATYTPPPPPMPPKPS